MIEMGMVITTQPQRVVGNRRRLDLRGVSGVERTLLIPLWARAMESRKPRPIVRDVRASELLDEVDFDFRVFRRAYGTQIGCVLRGLLYDFWVSEFLRSHPAGTIVELGAGLSTRFERLHSGRDDSRHGVVPASTWIDLDLPDVIALRARCFKKSPRRFGLGMSVVDDAWPLEVARLGSPPYLFISEGMLMYLREVDVRSLLVRIANAFPGAEIVLDSISHAVVRNQRHHDSMKHMMDVPFHWGIDDVSTIEDWDPSRRLRILDVAHLAEIARRFPDRVPRRLRFLANALRRTLPGLTSCYRLARIVTDTQHA